jgi:HK97 family phage major capsid protein
VENEKVIEVIDEKLKGYKDSLANEVKQANDNFTAEVVKLNEDLKAKGATLLDIQNEVKELKAQGGRLRANEAEQNDVKSAIAKIISENGDNIKGLNKGSMTVKAVANMTIGNNLTAGSAVSTYSLTVADEPSSILHFRQLVGIVPSATGIYQFPRFGGGEGALANQTEGAAKGQIDFDFAMITVNAAYKAGYVKFSKQMAEDLPFLQGYLPGRLVEEYYQQEDSDFFTTLSGAATGSSTVTGTPTVDVEQILGWVSNLKAANHRPNGIVLNPKDWYKILVTKPADYSLPGATVVDANGNIRLAGIPVYESTFIAEDKVMVGDWTKAKIVQTKGLNVTFTDTDQDDFVKNLMTARVEARVGLAVERPEAFVYGDLGNVA